MIRRYRLSVGLLLAGMALCVAGGTWLLAAGLWAPGILLLLGAVVCVMVFHGLQDRLIRTMSTFVKALEMDDTTVRVEAGGDRELNDMAADMNRISALYRTNKRELETRKLYYDRILRIMTHEMRNGITPLISLTADMELHPERYQGESLSEGAAVLHGQVTGIKRFLDSYYSLTHLPDPELLKMKASNYFQTVRRLFSAELERRGLPEETVTFTVPEDMEIEIDPGLMNQVMVNLLRNALDAIGHPVPDKDCKTVVGAEEVDADSKLCDTGRVEVVLTVSDERPYLTVSDNGPGISSEVMQSLFQPFFTTKPGGSGVGLSISRQIVRRHGGDLRLTSRPGHGTTVIITL